MEYRRQAREAVVMSGFGRNSDWLLNVEAKPDEEVELGGECFPAAHRFLDEEEAVRVLKGYEKRNWMVAPIVRRVLSWLLGWTYHGSEEDRQRVVEQLPLVAFRPR